MKPPLQFQTVHGRRAQLVNFAIAVAFVGLLALDSTGREGSSPLFAGGFTLASVAVVLALRLRLSGLFVEDDRIVSRRIFFDRSKHQGPALASLSLRPWYGVHQVMARGDLPYGVPCMLRFGSIVPSWLAQAPNELLVREAPVHRGRRRGRWEPTGIVWTDDDAFLGELAAYLDAALGIDPAAPVSAAAARTVREASYPEFRTSHSFRRGPLTMVRLVSSSPRLSRAVDRALRSTPPPSGALPVNRFSQLAMTGVLVKSGRLVTGGDFVTPGSLSIVDAPRGASIIAAVSTRGKAHRLPMLSNDPSIDEPNELLVRYPKAAQPSAAGWHGTGVMWGTDGRAICAHLEQALRGSHAQPAGGADLRDAA